MTDISEGRPSSAVLKAGISAGSVSDADSGYDDPGETTIPLTRTVFQKDSEGNEIAMTTTQWVTLPRRSETRNSPSPIMEKSLTLDSLSRPSNHSISSPVQSKSSSLSRPSSRATSSHDEKKSPTPLNSSLYGSTSPPVKYKPPLSRPPALNTPSPVQDRSLVHELSHSVTSLASSRENSDSCEDSSTDEASFDMTVEPVNVNAFSMQSLLKQLQKSKKNSDIFRFLSTPREKRNWPIGFKNPKIAAEVSPSSTAPSVEETAKRSPRRKRRSKSADGRHERRHKGPQSMFSPAYSKTLSPETMKNRKMWADVVRKDCILEEEYYKVPYEECNREIILGRFESSETLLNNFKRLRKEMMEKKEQDKVNKISGEKPNKRTNNLSSLASFSELASPPNEVYDNHLGENKATEDLKQLIHDLIFSDPKTIVKEHSPRPSEGVNNITETLRGDTDVVDSTKQAVGMESDTRKYSGQLNEVGSIKENSEHVNLEDDTVSPLDQTKQKDIHTIDPLEQTIGNNYFGKPFEWITKEEEEEEVDTFERLEKQVSNESDDSDETLEMTEELEDTKKQANVQNELRNLVEKNNANKSNNEDIWDFSDQLSGLNETRRENELVDSEEAENDSKSHKQNLKRQDEVSSFGLHPEEENENLKNVSENVEEQLSTTFGNPVTELETCYDMNHKPNKDTEIEVNGKSLEKDLYTPKSIQNHIKNERLVERSLLVGGSDTILENEELTLSDEVENPVHVEYPPDDEDSISCDSYRSSDECLVMEDSENEAAGILNPVKYKVEENGFLIENVGTREISKDDNINVIEEKFEDCDDCINSFVESQDNKSKEEKPLPFPDNNDKLPEKSFQLKKNKMEKTLNDIRDFNTELIRRVEACNKDGVDNSSNQASNCENLRRDSEKIMNEPVVESCLNDVIKLKNKTRADDILRILDTNNNSNDGFKKVVRDTIKYAKPVELRNEEEVWEILNDNNNEYVKGSQTPIYSDNSVHGSTNDLQSTESSDESQKISSDNESSVNGCSDDSLSRPSKKKIKKRVSFSTENEELIFDSNFSDTDSTSSVFEDQNVDDVYGVTLPKSIIVSVENEPVLQKPIIVCVDDDSFGSSDSFKILSEIPPKLTNSHNYRPSDLDKKINETGNDSTANKLHSKAKLNSCYNDDNPLPSSHHKNCAMEAVPAVDINKDEFPSPKLNNRFEKNADKNNNNNDKNNNTKFTQTNNYINDLELSKTVIDSAPLKSLYSDFYNSLPNKFENENKIKEKTKDYNDFREDKVNIFMTNRPSYVDHNIHLLTRSRNTKPKVSVSRVRVPLSSVTDHFTWVISLQKQQKEMLREKHRNFLENSKQFPVKLPEVTSPTPSSDSDTSSGCSSGRNS
ncbi:hypothetical protein Anas_01060, partial [Armadillidium nasatum]